MRRTFIVTLLLAFSLMLLAGCGPEMSNSDENSQQSSAASEITAETPTPTDEPTPEPTSMPTEEPMVEPAYDAKSGSSEIVGGLQPLNWGADDENCLIPGLVISGLMGSDVPCSPIDIGNQPADDTEADDTESDDTKADDAGTDDAGTDDTEIDDTETEADSGDEPTGVQDSVQNAQATEATTMAVKDLAQQLGVSEDQVNICDVCEVTWPDTSMGCPQPDMMYAQMLQEGYLIQMTVDGEPYFYHSGGMQAPFLCEETMQNLPDGVSVGE